MDDNLIDKNPTFKRIISDAMIVNDYDTKILKTIIDIFIVHK